MPLVPLTEELGRKRAAHLLRRTCFAGTISEIEAFASLTPSEAIAQLFNASIPDPILPLDPESGLNWVENRIAGENNLDNYFLGWSLGQMLAVGIQDDQKLAYIFRERIVYFLHTHFTTKKSVVNNTRALYYQQALFRLFAFDSENLNYTVTVLNEENEEVEETREAPRNFKQLIKKISIDNAMLVFLDGRLNVKGRPNENYARELLELYSIGRGLEGTLPEPQFDGDYFYFTETDVQEGAKVLSGYDVDDTFQEIDEETSLPRGIIKGGSVATQHEEGTKVFSSRLGSGSVVPDESLLIGSSPSAASVEDEVSQLIDLIFNQRETALHIGRELYRFFVYHQVDESLTDDIISEMADILEANEFKIQPVLTALLTSQHFYDAEPGVERDNKFGAVIKSPLDLVIGLYRSFEIAIPDYEEATTQFHELTDQLLAEMIRQGMDYYDPFEVAGYAAYHQFPIFNRSWITTNYLTNRYSFVQQRIATEDEVEMGDVNIIQFVEGHFPFETIRIADDLIVEVVTYFLPVSENLSFDTEGGDLTVERLNYFKSAMFSFDFDSDPEAAWTQRWDEGSGRADRAAQLKALFNALLQSPEYQLM